MKLAEPCGIAYICFAPRHVLGVTRIDQNDLEPVLLTARAYDTPRSLTSFTASSLNSRVNFRLSMTHLLLHKTPNLVSSEPGAAQWPNLKISFFAEAKSIPPALSPIDIFFSEIVTLM